eukprot:153539_1
MIWPKKIQINIVQKKNELHKKIKEMEESFKKSQLNASNEELQLHYLKAEKQRTDIKVESQANRIKDLKENDLKELNEAKEKLKKLENKAKMAENKELELAFFKAEKQRMDVAFEVTQSSLKQAKQLNKQLQQAVIHEKEERVSFERRMSKQFGVDDVNQLSNLAALHNKNDDEDGSQASELSSNVDNDHEVKSEWRNQVDKLKYKLANETMDKIMLQKKNKTLMHRLSTAENTQVNKLIQYTSGRTPPVRIDDNKEESHNKTDDDDENESHEPPPPPPDGREEDE